MINIKSLNILFIALCITLNAFSKDSNKPKRDTTTINNVTIVSEAPVEALLQKNIAVAKAPQSKGYRIQIYSGSNKIEANKLKNQFSLQYPNLNYYLIYKAPNYRLRVGDFANIDDANYVRHILLRDYNIALIVEDELDTTNIYHEGDLDQ